MALTKLAIDAARPRLKRFKLYDEKGLYLLITPTGSRLWGYKYKFAGVERSLRFGAYPEVSLKEARERRDDARRLLRDGEDPSAARKAARVAQVTTFKLVGKEYIAQCDLKANTIAKAYWQLKLLKPIHHTPIATLAAPELLQACQRIERNHGHESAHRANMLAGRIMRYACVTGRRTERDVSPDLKGSLKPVETVSHAGITDPQALGGLLRAIDAYDGSLLVRSALKLSALLFVRPGELRQARWPEFNLDAKEWLIPAERMKMGRPHLVPLAIQAVDILRDVYLDTCDNPFVFPGLRSGRPLSDNALSAALRSMFYTSDEHTVHGFRVTASTLLNEQGYDPAVVELQLAHAKEDKVAAVYNRAQRLPERRVMMQEWANYLDKLRLDRAEAA